MIISLLVQVVAKNGELGETRTNMVSEQGCSASQAVALVPLVSGPFQLLQLSVTPRVHAAALGCKCCVNALSRRRLSSLGWYYSKTQQKCAI